jgi:D-glycero-alpha-D-manno-heptose 1-phosphate guanylyltransferase
MKRKLRPGEAIILAGGQGTRLRSISGDLPKPMVPVCSRPFLEYLLRMLLAAGIRRTILAVGYRHDVISTHFGPEYHGMSLIYCVEEAPLGTGGAVADAFKFTRDEDVVLMNGDSYFMVDIGRLFAYHVEMRGDITMALKRLEDCARYGTVTMDGSRIHAFREKGTTGAGHINGGVYVVNRRIVEKLPMERPCSLETDFLAMHSGDLMFVPFICEGYFMDIGTPEDYRKAQTEFPAVTGAAG